MKLRYATNDMMKEYRDVQGQRRFEFLIYGFIGGSISGVILITAIFTFFSGGLR
ncbi:MAG: hypothetical protein HQK60_06580 [Deltaproteobacteria bacterium]|nr:hypothetical protein [Deltaproteobacteria bacterium]